MTAVRVGLLGFGQVGRAVAHLAVVARECLRARGCDVQVTHALVRDVSARRPDAGASPALEDDPDRFFRRPVDVVVEALGGVEPARSLVGRALDRGVPVVTANKSLVAVHGAALEALAARRGAAFRFEACALAGVPFIGTLGRRPLLSSVTRFSAILNGTTNFVLSAMARDRLPFAEALARAQALGLAEPDPAADVQGVDAAEKLAVLARHLGARTVALDAVERTGIGEVEPDDLAQAAALGGAIRPVAFAGFDAEWVSAFVGPAFVPREHPLASVSGRLNGIVLEGRFVQNLFFSGPGAGPDVTAASILDDVVEVVAGPTARSGGLRARAPSTACVRAPVTPWFVRLVLSPAATEATAIPELLAAHRVEIRRSSGVVTAGGATRLYVLTQPCTRQVLEGALSVVRAATGGQAYALRVLEG